MKENTRKYKEHQVFSYQNYHNLWPGHLVMSGMVEWTFPFVNRSLLEISDDYAGAPVGMWTVGRVHNKFRQPP